ncbi:MAG: Rieske 2Fe-2S domain-containing protein [Anaerolineales bacterium]|nr:Rieske 2Fe-2S domain-containing protein [Anaerolineales bacterium]
MKQVEADADGFYTVGKAAGVLEGVLTAVKLNNHRFLLTRYDGRLYAFSTICPHAAANMADGSLHRWKITCPDHDYCFDIRNGRILWPEDEHLRLRTYPIREEAGWVKVKLP